METGFFCGSLVKNLPANTGDMRLTPRLVAYQALLSVGFPKQENLSGLLFPSPGYLPNPGIELTSLVFTGRFSTTAPPGKSAG